jgi:hypothetical protein
VAPCGLVRCGGRGAGVLAEESEHCVSILTARVKTRSLKCEGCGTPPESQRLKSLTSVEVKWNTALAGF